MPKSARRDQAEGVVDRVAGRILETVSRLTGRPSHRAKGTAARGRGTFRGAKARGKRAAR